MASISVTMEDVVRELHLSLYKNRGISSDYICPFCKTLTGKKHPKLNINYHKQAFKCFSCDHKGGMFDLYSYYQSEVVGNPNYIGDPKSDENRKQARNDLVQTLGGYDERKMASRNNTIKANREKIKKETTIESIYNVDKCNIVYRSLLKICSLSKAHKLNLLERGLTEIDIEKYLLKSVPVIMTSTIIRRISEETGISDFEGVPGFYYNDTSLQWELVFNKYYKGILIPYYDLDGKISGLQIRLDNPQDNRYFWVSSKDKNRGTGAKSLPCYLPGNKKTDTIIITEGALKAMVSQSLNDCSFLAIAGVNNQDGIAEALYKLPYKKVYIAFDMDYLENPNVQEAKEKLTKKIKDANKVTKDLTWNPQYKGLDDYLLYKKRNEITASN